MCLRINRKFKTDRISSCKTLFFAPEKRAIDDSDIKKKKIHGDRETVQFEYCSNKMCVPTAVKHTRRIRVYRAKRSNTRSKKKKNYILYREVDNIKINL